MKVNSFSRKNLNEARLLLFFTGFIGGHRFYLEKKHQAILYIFIFYLITFLTLGYGTIAVYVYEFLKLENKVKKANNELEEDERSHYNSTQNQQSSQEVRRMELACKGLIEDLENKNMKIQIQLENAEKLINKSELKDVFDLENQKTLIKEELKLLENKRNVYISEISNLESKLENIKNSTIYWREIAEEESIGIFTRPEDLYPTEYYKSELKENREKQKTLKKEGQAASAVEMTLDGSVAKGRKMQKDNVNQILRSFDNESEVFIKSVSIKNYNSKLKGLYRSFEQLNKMNYINGVQILPKYLKLKEKELELSYKGLIAKEQERETLIEQREKEREEKQALKEIENKKAVVDKDINHYDKMMKELLNQISILQDENRKVELSNEIKNLEEQKKKKEKEKEDLDFRQKNAKAGYVYIISNIGAFGKDIFKIGVTRRLDPYERISELSSASVPFKFDVHAMVFSKDAFKLEAELHKFFENKRVNLVNNRKEFFNITIDEVEDKLKDYKNLTMNFTREPEALEYKKTQVLKGK